MIFPPGGRRGPKLPNSQKKSSEDPLSKEEETMKTQACFWLEDW